MRAGAGVVALAPFIQTLVINRLYGVPFTCLCSSPSPRLPNRQTVNLFFPCSIPPRPPLSSAQLITSPLPHLRPPTSSLPPSTLTCSPSGILSRPPSTNLDHGQIDFCVVQVRDSGACTQLTLSPPSSTSFFVLRPVQSFSSSQDRIEDEATAVGPEQPEPNRAPLPRTDPPISCCRVECSPVQPSAW